jgi:hypothetical protein
MVNEDPLIERSVYRGRLDKDGRPEAYSTDAVETRRDRRDSRQTRLISCAHKTCHDRITRVSGATVIENTVDSFMIKDEIFAGARQTKPLRLCLCVIKRERRFLPAELTAIELPIDVQRGSYGRNSLTHTERLSIRQGTIPDFQYPQYSVFKCLVVMVLPVLVISASHARDI